MSASTEKKRRTNARDEMTMAERREAQKKAKEKRKWIIGSVVVVLFVAAVIFFTSSFSYRILPAYTVENTDIESLEIKSDSTTYSVAEYNYVFYSLYNQYNSIMQSYMGSGSISLSDIYPYGEDSSQTWRDYFNDYSKSQLTEWTVQRAYAESKGLALDDTDKATIEEEMTTLKTTAESNGWSSVGALLSSTYGKGVNESVVRDMLELQILASKVSTYEQDQYSFTDEEIKAEYASIADQYDGFTYNVYSVAAETVTGDDGTAAATEETLAAAAATAEKIDALISGGKTIDEAVASVIGEVDSGETDDSGAAIMKTAASTAHEAVTSSSFETGISDWMLAEERSEGDHDVITSDTGAYVVVYGTRDNNEHTTDESGDMLYCDYIADKTLRSEKYNEWYSNEFATIKESFTGSQRFAAKFVG